MTNKPSPPVEELGPLDWRIAITDHAGRPTPEFQRRWNTQRGDNALISNITTGSGAPTNPPLQNGYEYIDIAATPPVIYVAVNGSWVKVGVYAFIQLTDTPHSYAGAAGEFVRVNLAGTGLEFSSVLNKFGAAFSSQDISTKPISTVIARFSSPIAWTLPAAPTGFVEGKVDVAPTVDTLLDLRKDGTSFGSAKWAAGTTVPTLICASSVSFAAGDYLDLATPANLNGMKGAFGLSIVGTNP